ncbi:MAG: UDP-glucose 4-epimerase [Candidatus Sumerlaeota bacterium]|nr:UDP-glucose 4-epimerase [Candidatus Sumerlaeota bacterium]
MNILVTGGAGYIGSVTTETLRLRGDRVVVIDNLATGHRAAVDSSVPLFCIDLKETDKVAEVLTAEKIDAVVHFAAFSLVGESVTNPAKYMDNNVGGTLSLLRAMLESGTKCLVFSSTAATYGEPEAIPLQETHPTRPANPYGLTKRFMEQAMEAYAAAHGLRFVALRYFNACGAIPTRGEDHRPESHLIPLVLQVALGQRESIQVFGTDYDTPDGTCVRDYIHVADLADAHLRALDMLEGGGQSLICNLGNGAGYSVREVVQACREVTGREITVVEGPRRAGDPSRLIADASLAKKRLGWAPRIPDLRQIVLDAWTWHSTHPEGYAE